MSRAPQRAVLHRVDPKMVAYWYFRLNGFSRSRTVSFTQRRGGQRTDADLLAVCFPFRVERLFDDPNDIMADDERQLAFSRDLIDVVIAEDKTNQPCTLNGPWTRQGRQNVHRVLAAIGCLPANRIELAAADIYRAGVLVGDFGLRIRLVTVRECSDKSYSEVTQLIWADMLAFIWDRFHRYRQQNRVGLARAVDQAARRSVCRSGGFHHARLAPHRSANWESS